MKQSRWQDWVMLVFGVWLFISPFIMNYVSYGSIAAWNSYIMGVAVALFALFAIAAPRMWEEWVNLLLGVWLIVSPFVLGYSHVAAASWNHVILGIIIAVDALWAMASSVSHRETHA